MKFFLIFFIFNNSFALTLEEAIQKLSQNENWQRSINQVLIRENDTDIALSAMLPSLNLLGSFTKQNEAANPLVGDEQKQILLNLTQPLFQGFKEFRSKNYAELVLKAQKFIHETTKRELTFNLIQIYFNLLIAQAEVELLQEANETSQNIKAEMVKREKIGLVRKSELLSAKAQALKTQTQLDAAKEQLLTLKTSFWRYLGEKSNPSNFVTPKNLNRPIEIETIYQNHPALAASKIMLKASEEFTNIQKSNHYPNVNLGLNYYLEQEGVFNERQWDATVNLNFPLYSGGRTSNEIYRAKLLEKDAGLSLLMAQRNLLEALKNLYTQYSGAKTRLEALRASVQMANRNYLELRRENQLKLITNIEVMNGLNQYIQEKRAFNQLRLNMLNYQYKLLALAGKI